MHDGLNRTLLLSAREQTLVFSLWAETDAYNADQKLICLQPLGGAAAQKL